MHGKKPKSLHEKARFIHSICRDHIVARSCKAYSRSCQLGNSSVDETKSKPGAVDYKTCDSRSNVLSHILLPKNNSEHERKCRPLCSDRFCQKKNRCVQKNLYIIKFFIIQILISASAAPKCQKKRPVNDSHRHIRRGSVVDYSVEDSGKKNHRRKAEHRKHILFCPGELIRRFLHNSEKRHHEYCIGHEISEKLQVFSVLTKSRKKKQALIQ